MFQHLDLVEQFVVALVVAFWNFFLLLEVESGRLHVLIGIFVDYFLVDGLHFVEFVLFVHGVLLEDLEPADGVLGVFVLEADGVLCLLLFHHDGALVVDEGLLFVVDVVLDVEGLEGGGGGFVALLEGLVRGVGLLFEGALALAVVFFDQFVVFVLRPASHV
jgi:hypothetical protein